MRECEKCGNEISAGAGVCPSCKTTQSNVAPRRKRMVVETINLEAGRPTVQEAMAHLERALASARYTGVRVLRIIHGWGSSGCGGKICAACRAYLQRELNAKRLKLVVPGEKYTRATVAGRELLSRYEQLVPAERTDTNNPGITFVEL